MTDWSSWIGREEIVHDRLTASAVGRLYATLDRADPGGDVAPPLAHWLCFLPAAAQSAIDRDGHPTRGGFLPPIALPRRMWASGRLTFHADLPVDAPLTRRSMIAAIDEKAGQSGPLVFVTVRHEVSSEGGAIVTEDQNLVYRDAARAAPALAPAPPPESEPCDAQRSILPDPALLFRFSALTFNAHRIHYDRDYAREVEGYAGLVVHGPLLATLLMHEWLDANVGVSPRAFAFRAQRPLIDGAPVALRRAASGGEMRLWSCDAAGFVTMTATVE